MSYIKECLSDLATQPLLYTDTIHGDQVMRDDLWVVSTDELNANQAEITRLTAIIKENEADKWISVKDKKPKEREDILVTDGNVRRIGYFRQWSREYFFVVPIYDGEERPALNVTHWMPLPDYPAMRVKGE